MDIMLLQNWAGLGTELIRIADGRRLDVIVQFWWGSMLPSRQSQEQNEICSYLTEEFSFVASIPNIRLQVVDLGIPSGWL
jgi:hypothetical protein